MRIKPSPREIEVLELVARGYRNPEIANALCIAPGTVKVHLKHISVKLETNGRHMLVEEARYLGFID
jgi:DNA-binding CsgD family transcriptional regulator